jgi:hypothetical protein
MTPISYQVVGEEDYALRISIDSEGGYTVENGTYTSQAPRKGQLSPEQQRKLLDALRQLGIPVEHPMPEGATAFEAELKVGMPGDEVRYAFWEGALENDKPLNALVRVLESV